MAKQMAKLSVGVVAASEAEAGLPPYLPLGSLGAPTSTEEFVARALQVPAAPPDLGSLTGHVMPTAPLPHSGAGMPYTCCCRAFESL